jgi:hypothetical protein
MVFSLKLLYCTAWQRLPTAKRLRLPCLTAFVLAGWHLNSWNSRAELASRVRARVRVILRLAFTANQFILLPSPLRLTAIIFCLHWTPAVIVPTSHPLWRQDGSVVYNCCWPSLAQSSSGPSPAGMMTIFPVSDSRCPQPSWRPGPHIYIPQEQGGPVIPPGTDFPCRCLLRLTVLRWRYSTPPPHGVWMASNAQPNAYVVPARTA